MKALLLENLALKLSAVLLALLLWLFVTSSGQSEISFNIPIEYKNVPAGLGIVKTSAQTVDITIRGRERIVKTIKNSDIRITVELSKAKKGEGTFYIHKNNISLPYAVSVMSVQPSSLKVRLEEMGEKTVMVKPVIIGIPAKGFLVKSILVDPDRITVHGLKSEIRKIKELRTEALDISGLNEAVTQVLSIDISGARVKPDETAVEVKVIITQGEK